MKLPRFRLSSVLICFTVVALLLGYTQWRRDDLRRTVSDLQAKGCLISFKDNALWPARPKIARISFRKWPGGYYTLYNGPSVPVDSDCPDANAERFDSMPELVPRLKQLRSELMLDLGVGHVALSEEVDFYDSGSTASHGKSFEDIGVYSSDPP